MYLLIRKPILLYQGPTLITSFPLTTSLEIPLLNMATVSIRAIIHAFGGGGHKQSVLNSHLSTAVWDVFLIIADKVLEDHPGSGVKHWAQHLSLLKFSPPIDFQLSFPIE